MLRLPTDSSLWTAAERHAIAILADTSRVLVAAPTVNAVQLRIVDAESTSASLDQLRSRNWSIEASEGEVRIGRDLLRAIIDVAGGVTESQTRERDRFGRVPSVASPLVAAAKERTVAFSGASLALRNAVISAAQGRPVRLLAPWPNGRRWAAALSHDLDVVDKWPVFTGLRLAELLAKREVGRSAKVLAAAATSAPFRPTLRGVHDVLEIERSAGVRSTWFILCGTPTFRTMRAGDLTYRPEGKGARRILAAIAGDDHEIGLHGSFDTYTNAELFAAQRERLARLVGREIHGVRQHYLRMQPGATQRGMHQAGFTFDSTCGFADRNGVRLGFADVLPTWDPERGSPIDLDEAPFTWMDRALSKYQKIEDPMRWIADGLALADECQNAQGMWVGIWHPNLTTALGFPGAVPAYSALVQGLVDRNAFIAPIGDLVAWRSARRNAIATASLADGSVAVEFRTDGRSGMTLVIEDEHGQPVQRVITN